MADGPNTEYKPSGDGPHPTLAGNVLDPGVSADGKMSAGQGVGGTDESTIKQEGMEHIKSNLPESQQPTGSSGLPGTSSTSGTDSSTGAASGGMMDTVKSYLGMGGSGTTTNTSERDTSALGSENVDPNASSTSPAMGESNTLGSESMDPKSTTTDPTMDKSSTLGSESMDPTTTDPAMRETSNLGSESIDPKTTSDSRDGLEAGGAGAAATGAAAATGSSMDGASDTATSGTPSGIGKDTMTSSNDPASNTEANAAPPTDSNVNTGAPPTESADPSSKDTAFAQKSNEATADDPVKPAGRGTQGGLENKDAIPTAGGEKLGEKHWGESGIVPDNPKPKTEEGVSGKDGQPTKETADNTAKNAGHHQSSGDGEKEGLVDKIKDKLHIGGKHKE